METVETPILLKKFTEQPANKYPFTIPCLILKDTGRNKLSFTNYLIDKDILAQILYEVFYQPDLPQSGIPIVIALENNLIGRLESKGVYVLDGHKDQFVYLFDQEEHQEFFEQLMQMKADSQITTNLVVAYLTSKEDPQTTSFTYFEKLERYIDLHGGITGRHVHLDVDKGFAFPLMNQEFTLKSFSWIEMVTKNYE